MSDPLSIWIEKKQFLEAELAITSDASQKFSLRKQIQECDQQIQRLKNQTNFQANFHPDSKTNSQSQSNQASSLNNQPNQVNFDNQISNSSATHLPLQQPQLAQLVQPQTNQAQQLNKQNEQTYLVPSNIDKTTNTINNASVNTKYSDQLIQLLKQKFDSLKDKEPMQFLLSLEDFLTFISRDNNPIKSITKSLENELLQKYNSTKNQFEIEKSKAIEIKNKLIENYPEIDDSSLQSTNSSCNPKPEFSIKEFNPAAKSPIKVFFYNLEDTSISNESLFYLLIRLGIKIDVCKKLNPQNNTSEKIISEIDRQFSSLNQQHKETHENWVKYCQSNPAEICLLRLLKIISKVNPSSTSRFDNEQFKELVEHLYESLTTHTWIDDLLHKKVDTKDRKILSKIKNLKQYLKCLYEKIHEEMVLANHQPQTQPLEPKSQSNSSNTPQTSNSLLPSLQTGNKSTINIGVQPNLKAISSKTFKQNQIVKNLAISKGNQSSMDNYLLNELKEKITNNKAVLFIGTGVSISASNNNPLSSWQGLLKAGVERCVSLLPTLRPDWKDDMLKLIGSDMTDLLSAAQQIEDRLKRVGSGHYKQWLLDTIGSLSIIKPDIIDSIKSLSLPIVTTNYDELLEKGTGLREIIWNDSFQVDRFFRGEEQGIFHLHGYYRNSDSVILSFTNYQNILGSSLTQSFLQALRIGKTLIFIGCGDGLQDPNFKSFLEFGSQALSQSGSLHYRLIRQNEFATFKQYHPDGSGIFPIVYGNDYDDLAPFITSLNP